MKNLINIMLLCMICFQYSINAQNPVPIKNYNGSDNSGIRENVISQVGNSLYYTTFTYPNGSLYRLDAGDTEPVKWATFSFDDVDELQQFDDHVLVFILPDDNIKLYTDPNTYTQINFNTSLGGLTRTYPSDRGILVVPNENNYYFLSENNNQVYKLNYFIDVDFADIKEIHNIDDRYLYVQYSDLDNTRFVYDLQNDALIDVKEFLNEKYNVQVVDILFSEIENRHWLLYDGSYIIDIDFDTSEVSLVPYTNGVNTIKRFENSYTIVATLHSWYVTKEGVTEISFPGKIIRDFGTIETADYLIWVEEGSSSNELKISNGKLDEIITCTGDVPTVISNILKIGEDFYFSSSQKLYKIDKNYEVSRVDNGWDDVSMSSSKIYCIDNRQLIFFGWSADTGYELFGYDTNSSGIKDIRWSENQDILKSTLVSSVLQVKNNQIFDTYQIFDSNGKLVKEANEINNTEINVENLQAGLYIIKLVSKDQHYSAKFIKN
ncbi:MAG: T9SS type A sorting domain-containing protein [Saprospiraceae bacterium]|nr:T9SS type A sorting domain-containing protein [Saprospiraceae bacterium]